VKFSPSGDKAYVTNASGNSISVIDCSDFTVSKTITGFDAPINLCFNPVLDRSLCSGSFLAKRSSPLTVLQTPKHPKNSIADSLRKAYLSALTATLFMLPSIKARRCRWRTPDPRAASQRTFKGKTLKNYGWRRACRLLVILCASLSTLFYPYTIHIIMQKPKLPQQVFDLYDQYAHNKLSRLEFIRQLSVYAVGGLTLPALSSNT
jgi:YVTN family beta-propeller protein